MYERPYEHGEWEQHPPRPHPPLHEHREDPQRQQRKQQRQGARESVCNSAMIAMASRSSTTASVSKNVRNAAGR
jgi:hypothetical protein